MKMWKPYGVTLQNNKNLEVGLECQDSLAASVKNGVSVVVLSTGAKETHSAFASELVSQAVCKFVSNNFTKLYLEEDTLVACKSIIDDVEHRLLKKCKKFNCTIDDFATSLCFVAVKEDKQCLIGQVGSGLICSNKNLDWDVVRKVNQMATSNDVVTNTDIYAKMSLVKEEITDATSFAILSKGSEEGFVKKAEGDLTPIMYMNNWISTETEDEVINSIVDSIESKAQFETEEDCGIIFLSKVEQLSRYELLEYEDKEEIFSKHYSHIYNSEAAIEDASNIIKLLKTTEANAQYISKKTKISIASCKKVTSILQKAGFLYLVDDIFSVVKVDDVNE